MTATKSSMAPPSASPAAATAGLIAGKQLSRTNSLCGLSSMAPPKPPLVAVLPPWAALFSNVRWDTVVVMPGPAEEGDILVANGASLGVAGAVARAGYR